MGVVVRGTGSCLPKKNVTNRDLAATVDTNDAWIRTRTGIRSRRISTDGEFAHILAARAAEKAMAMAGVAASEINLIIVATISSHMLMPSCACFVQSEIGATNAFAFDVNAACSGFLYSVDIAEKYIKADHDQKILVIGVETLSARVDWQDRNTCVLFGDGAGAAVLAYEDGPSGYIGSNLFADGKLWNLLYMHAPISNNPDLQVPDNPGAHIVMEGKEIFKYAVKGMEDAVRGLLLREGFGIEDVQLFVPHQANMRILSNLMERLSIPEDKVFVNVADYGNTSAASIPIALDEANRGGRISKGDIVLFCSFGGGLTWGAGMIKW